MIFEPMITVLFLLMSGYLAKILNVLHPNDKILLIDFMLTFALPAMIVERIYHLDFDINLIYAIHLGLIASIVAAGFSLFLGCILKFDKITILCITILAYFGNSVLIGLPVTQGFFGKDVITQVILYDQIVTSIPLAVVAPFVLAINMHTKTSFIHNLMKIVKFPPFLALIFAVILKNFYLPDFIFEPLRLLSGCVVPLSLFSIGLGISFGCIKNAWKSSIIVLVGRMIIAPIVYIATLFIFDIKITQEWMVSAMLCAMPPMAGASAVIIKANLNQDLAIASIAIGVLISFFTMPLIYLILS